MAAPSVDLRPRGAVDVFDAAVHLVSRQSGLWAITLPSSGLVVVALLHWVDALLHRRAFAEATLGLSAAWCVRGVTQGAACAFVNDVLLGTRGAGVYRAWRTALAHLPSLLVTAGYLFVFNLATLPTTLGLGFLLGAQTVGYAVALEGKGHPLRLWGTCARLLGPARGSAVGVRLLYAMQFLAMLNFHLAANVGIYLARKLMGLDLTFAQRFASVDNPIWDAAVVALVFALFEPLRAATAALLLVDGRVRQEGLDLTAALERIPRRRGRRMAKGVAVLIATLGAWALPSAVRAEEGDDDDAPAASVQGVTHLHTGAPVFDPAEGQRRLRSLARRCKLGGAAVDRQLRAAGELSLSEVGPLARLVADAEGLANTEGCAAAGRRLRLALPLLSAARDFPAGPPGSADPGTQARAILSRPEFQPDPASEKADSPARSDEPPGWLLRFLRWLARLFEDTQPSPVTLPQSTGTVSARTLAAVLATLAVVLVGALALYARSRPSATPVAVIASNPQPLTPQLPGALARAPEDWATLADELAGSGQVREAIRALYLALLAHLHRAGAIDYDPAHSNWDYCRAFKGRPEWRAGFRDLTRIFDGAYYGRTPMQQEHYQDFRRVTQPMLGAEPEAPHA